LSVGAISDVRTDQTHLSAVLLVQRALEITCLLDALTNPQPLLSPPGRGGDSSERR
jgi:hypothetical protein